MYTWYHRGGCHQRDLEKPPARERRRCRFCGISRGVRRRRARLPFPVCSSKRSTVLDTINARSAPLSADSRRRGRSRRDSFVARARLVDGVKCTQIARAHATRGTVACIVG